MSQLLTLYRAYRGDNRGRQRVTGKFFATNPLVAKGYGTDIRRYKIRCHKIGKFNNTLDVLKSIVDEDTYEMMTKSLTAERTTRNFEAYYMIDAYVAKWARKQGYDALQFGENVVVCLRVPK